MGRFDLWVAEAADGLGAMLVRHEEDDVGSLRDLGGKRSRGGVGEELSSAICHCLGSLSQIDGSHTQVMGRP